MRGLDQNAFQPRVEHRITCAHLVEDALGPRPQDAEIASKRIGTHAEDTAKNARLVHLPLQLGRIGYSEGGGGELAVGVATQVVRHQEGIAGQSGGNSDVFATKIDLRDRHARRRHPHE